MKWLWKLLFGRRIKYLTTADAPTGPETTLYDVPDNVPFYCVELHFCGEVIDSPGWGETASDGWLYWYGSSVDALDNIDAKKSRCVLLAEHERLVIG